MKYAICLKLDHEKVGHARDDYLVMTPSGLRPREDVNKKSPWCLQPFTTHDLQEAERLAADRSALDQVEWKVERTVENCPKCKREIWADDGDHLYPCNQERTYWQCSCNQHDFGCGYTVHGSSMLDVMDVWDGIKPADNKFRDLMLAAPSTQVDHSLFPLIGKWEHMVTAPQLLEVMDLAVHGGLTSGQALGFLQVVYDAQLVVECRTHEQLAKNAPWRRKDGSVNPNWREDHNRELNKRLGGE